MIVEGLSGLGYKKDQINILASSIYESINGHPYLTQRIGGYLQENILTVSLDSVVDLAKKSIMADDPLLDHLRRALRENDLVDALDKLLRGSVKFSRTDEEMVKLDILGLAREENRFWKIRNTLLQDVAIELIKKKSRKVKITSKPKPKKFKNIRVFVSSTWVDLQPERESVEKTLHHMRDTAFSGMEYFGSQEDTPLKVSLKAVDDSNVYIGIFAHRFGSGITEKEYRRAIRNHIPCLIYIKGDDAPVKPAYMEQKIEARKKMKLLKNELRKKHVVSVYIAPDELANKVAVDLHNLLNT